MAKCTKCGADIKSGGYDTEELKLPNATAIQFLVSNVSIIKERDEVEPKQRMLNGSIDIEIMAMHGLI